MNNFFRKKYLSCFLIYAFSLLICFGDDPVRVAVFKGGGVGRSYQQLINTLEKEGDRFTVSRISPEEIREGKLSRVDVLVHPGGSGSGQAKALEKEGREAVRDFVRNGGGFLGVCAGAYLATNDYDWSLNLIDAKVVDRKHWARGKGEVTLKLSPKGTELFQAKGDEMKIHYAQGPLLARHEWDSPDVPNYESLAIFATEIAEKGAPKGVMARTSAAVRADYGKGRVFCFSPHPELTEGLDHLIPLTVGWAAGKK